MSKDAVVTNRYVVYDIDGLGFADIDDIEPVNHKSLSSFSIKALEAKKARLEKKIESVKAKIAKDNEIIPYNEQWEDETAVKEGRHGKELAELEDELEKVNSEIENKETKEGVEFIF